VKKEEQIRLFLERRIDFERRSQNDLDADEETWDSEPEDEPGAHHRAFLSNSIEEFGLDVVLDGIGRFELTEPLCPPNDFHMLAVLLAERGRRDDARRAADRMNELSFDERVDALVDIAYATGAVEDVIYAESEARTTEEPLEYAKALIYLAPIAPRPVEYVDIARKLLSQMFGDATEKLEALVPHFIRLATLTKLEADLLMVVRLLDHPVLQDSPGYAIFEGSIVHLKDAKLALRVAARVKNAEWRTKYQRAINNRREDLN
jgi:hypothetical protein